MNHTCKNCKTPATCLEIGPKCLPTSFVEVPSETINPVAATLEQRGSRYGDFAEHAWIAEQFLQVMMTGTSGELRVGWRRLSPVQRHALRIIADKIARILNGDPNYSDNWHDIQGYARLVEERLPKVDK